jgi:hypothetical protein
MAGRLVMLDGQTVCTEGASKTTILQVIRRKTLKDVAIKSEIIKFD